MNFAEMLASLTAAFHGVIGRELLSRWEYFRYEGRLHRLTIRDTPNPLERWFLG